MTSRLIYIRYQLKVYLIQLRQKKSWWWLLKTLLQPLTHARIVLTCWKCKGENFHAFITFLHNTRSFLLQSVCMNVYFFQVPFFVLIITHYLPLLWDFFSCFEGTRLLITRCLDKQLRWKRIALLRKFCKSNVWPCRTNVCVWLNFKLEVINRVLTIKIFLSLLSNSSAVSFKMKINKSESNLTPRIII